MNKSIKTNTLYIMSGAPGTGKSTFLKKNNIPEHLIVSSDKIREQLLGKSLKIDEFGKYESISNNVNIATFNILETIVNTKLQEGQTVFIDATNSTDMARQKYVKLAENNNMPSKILIFGANLTIEEIKEQNKNRSKRVGEYVIDKYCNEMEYESKFDYIHIDNNNKYELIPRFKIDTNIELTVIGDIHGLKDELIQLLNQENFYIENNTIRHENPIKKVAFVGDIIDRGDKSLEMLDLVKNSIQREGHYMVLGNHENKLLRMFNKYKNKESTEMFRTSEAVSRTFSEFLKLPNDKKEEIYKFYKSLPFYLIQDDTLIVHGNIENSDINTLNRNDCLYGSKSDKSDATYHKLYEEGINKYKLIRGHVPILDINDTVLSVEASGIDGGNILMYNLKNRELFKQKCDFKYTKESSYYNGKRLTYRLEELGSVEIDKFNKFGEVVGTKKIPLVTYKDSLDGTMRIYKYSKQVFFNNLWEEDPLLKKARGLVLDGNGKIIQHPFDKIFNYGENKSGLNIDDKTKVIAVEKWNGFLGNITYHNNELLVTTTGSFDSDFVGYIKDFFMNKSFEYYNPALKANLIKYLRENDQTLMFEVIHPNDPHIIEYDNDEMGLKLIGARGKKFTDKELSGPELDIIGNKINVPRAEYFEIEYGDLKETVKNCNIEGYMVRDKESSETLLKFKSPYYLTTKFIARMSSSNIEFMFGNPEKFKEKVDEEYYDLIDSITYNNSKADFLLLKNSAKIELIRSYINDQRVGELNIN